MKNETLQSNSSEQIQLDKKGNERKMGFEINLNRRKLIDLSVNEFYGTIAKKLFEHGVILVSNQEDLTLEEYVEVCSRFGPGIKLPSPLGFYNIQNNFPELVRVGNINSKGELVRKHVNAEYWHCDGNFWPNGQHHILNFLFSHICPEKGGETAFFDMEKLYDRFSPLEQELYEKSTFELNIEKIRDFKGINADELKMQRILRHSTVNVNPLTGRKSIYVGSGISDIEYIDGRKESGDAFLERHLSNKNDWYIHKWKKGDILIWDNLQVMHRGMGGYFDSARLLYRCQARLTQFYITKLLRLIK